MQVHGNERNLFVLPRATGGQNADGSDVRAEMTAVFGDLKKLLQPGVIPARVEGQAFKVPACLSPVGCLLPSLSFPFLSFDIAH